MSKQEEGLGSGPREVGRRLWREQREVSAEQAVRQLERRLRAAQSRCANVERELEASEQRLRSVALAIEDALYIRDADGQLCYASQAFDAVFGATCDELAGTPERWLALIHHHDRQRVREAMVNLLRGDPFDEQYRIEQAQGGLRWVRDRAFLLRDERGRARRIVGVARDITAERALQRELQHGRKLEAVGAMTSSVAHDFNNVLMGVGACLEAALAAASCERDNPPAHGRSEAARLIREGLAAARRGQDLAEQLLRFARKQPAPTRRVAVDAALERARCLIAGLAGHAVTLRFDLCAPRAQIRVQPNELEQLLLNLASNARDAMPDGGALVVTTRLRELDDAQAARRGLDGAGHYVELSVRDTGHGISPSLRQQVFEPFFTTKPPGRGTGLGLSAVQAIVRNRGGSLDTRSGRDGTEVRMWFPALPLGAANAASAPVGAYFDGDRDGD